MAFILNYLNLSFTNIWGLHSNFVDCESFLKWNSPDILALCETNLDGSTDSGNFSVRGYLPLIWWDSSTHMHSLAAYVKEELPFAWDLSLKNSADSYLFLTGFTSLSAYLLFLYWSPSSSLCMFFYSILSNMDDVLSIKPSANVLSLETLMSIIRTGLPILVELINLIHSVIIFLSQTTWLGWLSYLDPRLWFS